MKTQMRFQKILTLVTLIIAALTFVSAIFLCSGIISESRLYTTEYRGATSNNEIGADALFARSQEINNVLVVMAIVFIVAVALLYITACNKRRNYYITNYVAIGVTVLYAAVFAIVGIALVAECMGLAGDIDMAKWFELYEEHSFDKYGNPIYPNPRNYSESYASMIFAMLTSVLTLACAGAWVYNVLWKIKLMKGEKALLEAGMVKEVA